MKVSKAGTIWIDYHRAHSKKIQSGPPRKNTVRSYKPIIDQFCLEFGGYGIDQVSSDDILRFLNRFTEGNKPYTKRIRYSHICSLFNFIRNNLDHSLQNPCDSPMVRKQYCEWVASVINSCIDSRRVIIHQDY